MADSRRRALWGDAHRRTPEHPQGASPPVRRYGLSCDPMKPTLIVKPLAALCLLAASIAAHAAGTPFAWPHGARAAVSLAYDDAIDSQLDNAIPALDRAGLKGSFYIKLSSPSLARRMPEWRAAAARGHELGNHPLFHQCSAALPDRTGVAPEDNIDTTR